MKTPTLLLTVFSALLGSVLPAKAQSGPNLVDGRNGFAYAATVRTLTTSDSVSNKDHTILANAATAAITVTLPAIRTKYMVLVIKKIDVTTNAVTITPASPSTIDGAATLILSSQHQRVTLQATDTGWAVLSPNVGAVRKVSLGAPRDDETNRAVTSTNMKVGAYTIANQPDVPRNVTITQTTVSGADTLGTVVVVGTDYRNNALTETLTPVAGTLVSGTKIFKTVTSITGVGWVINTTADTIVSGYGALIGLPVTLPAAGTVLGTLDTVVAVKVTTGGSISTSAVTEASGDGSKILTVYLDQ